MTRAEPTAGLSRRPRSRRGRAPSTTTRPPSPTPLRKAAILVVSLEQPLASQLLRSSTGRPSRR